MKITSSDILHTYGSIGLNMDYAVRLSVRLTDDIKKEDIIRATELTAKRYPYMSVRMTHNDSEIFYEKNEEKVAVINTSERITLSGAESNYHIWAVAYYNDYIHLDIYHGMLDGTGMYMVLSTLLYYYCNIRYGLTDHTGIRTLDDEINPLENADPLENVPSLDEIPKPRFDEAFSLIRDAGLTRCECKVWDITLDESEFVTFAKGKGVSPGGMVSLLIARAIDRLYPNRSKPLGSSYIINARPMIDANETIHNCVNTMRLDYSDEIKILSLEEQAGAYRKIIKECSTPQYVMGVNAVTVTSNRMRLKAPEIEGKIAEFGKALMGGQRLFTFMVSYIGKWKYTSVEKYITDFKTHVPEANELLIELAAVGGKFYINVHQLFEEDCVIHEVMKELSDNGIAYEMSGPMVNDRAKCKYDFG